MDPEQVKILLIAGGVAAVGLAAGYFIARYLKGSITVSLPRTAFNPGEQIEGSFQLLTRKEVNGNNLTAVLVATETTRERGYNGKTRTHTREIYRSGQTLEHARVYPAGYAANYEFKIPVPAEQSLGGSDSILGQALNLINSFGRRIAWKVEVRLDAEGVDLASSKGVTVNRPGLF